jgi:hypothetical protein
MKVTDAGSSPTRTVAMLGGVPVCSVNLVAPTAVPAAISPASRSALRKRMSMRICRCTTFGYERALSSILRAQVIQPCASQQSRRQTFMLAVSCDSVGTAIWGYLVSRSPAGDRGGARIPISAITIPRSRGGRNDVVANWRSVCGR